MKKTNPQSGAAMVEFALLFPILIGLTCGIIQLSLLFTAKQLSQYACYKACRAQLVYRDPVLAANMIMAPVGGYSSADTPYELYVPGPGYLKRSGRAANRLRLSVIEDGPEFVTMQLEYDLELLFPFLEIFLGENTFASGEDDQGQPFVTLSEEVTLARAEPRLENYWGLHINAHAKGRHDFDNNLNLMDEVRPHTVGRVE